MVFSVMPLNPSHSSLALPLSLPCPSQTAPLSGSHALLPWMFCPTLGLSDPPQHPSKFCLNVAFPGDYPLPIPFHSPPPPPKSPRPSDCYLSWYLSTAITKKWLKSHVHMYLFMSLYTWAVQLQQPPKAIKHLETHLVWIVMCCERKITSKTWCD